MARRGQGKRKGGRKEAERDYARQYHAVIDLIWGYLQRNEQAIYPVVERLANCYTRHTDPLKVSQALIGKMARRERPICQARVSIAIDGLESWGVVVKKWTAKGLSYYLPRETEVITFLFQRARAQGLPRDLFWRLCLYYWRVDVPDMYPEVEGQEIVPHAEAEVVQAAVDDGAGDWVNDPQGLCGAIDARIGELDEEERARGGGVKGELAGVLGLAKSHHGT